MIYDPDNYEQFLSRFRLKLHLAGKGYPSAREAGTSWCYEAKEPAPREPDRVTDNRASWHLRRLDHNSERSPTREAHKGFARHHVRASLILQALLIWGAVACAVWFLFL